MNGAGTWVLSAGNAYTGGTKITAGVLVAANTAALGAAASKVTMTGGTLDLQTDTSVNAWNTTVSGNSTILSDRFTASVPALPKPWARSSIGTRNPDGRYRVQRQRRAPPVTFGATTLTGNATVSPAAGTLTLGAVSGALYLDHDRLRHPGMQRDGEQPHGRPDHHQRHGDLQQ